MRPHSAGIGAGASFIAGLVVLRRRERNHPIPVHQADEARLLALKEVLHHHPFAGRAERLVAKRRLERGDRLVHGAGDGDPLSPREPVRLDHARSAARAHVVGRRAEPVEGLVAGGRDPVPDEERLGEALGAFEARGARARAEAGVAFGGEGIREPGHERRFGADHRQRDPARGGKLDEAVDVVGRNRDILDLRLPRGPRVAGGNEDPFHPRRGGELPRESVLASAPADHQHLHPRLRRLLRSRERF